MQNKIFLTIFAGFFATFGVASAAEMIPSFDSVMHVNTDGTMDVTETIVAYHEGKSIRRGIYRDLPLTKGLKYELVSVNRNGKYEPSFVENIDGYYRINTGDDSFLPSPGTSTFEIKYRVWNLPRSYDGYDEVHWNVTGDGWSLPIYNVSAKVELPSGAEILQQASYVGEYGDKNSANYAGNGQYHAENLQPGEQMTIAVGFTPGIVETYKPAVKDVDTKPANFNPLIVGLAGITIAQTYLSKNTLLRTVLPLALYFVYLAFLVVIWYKKGRDPKARAIMPQYLPPKDLTAAQAACLYHKGVPENVATISLVQMIANGYLKLTVTKKKILKIFSDTIYTLTKTGCQPSNQEEKCFTDSKIVLDGGYNSDIEDLVNDIKSCVKTSMKEYYTNNKSAVAVPSIIYLAFTCMMWWPGLSPLFLMVFGFAFVVAVAHSLGMMILLFLGMFVLFPFISLMFMFGNIAVTDANILSGENLSKIGFVVFIIVTYIVFAILMYQPTEKGQRLTEYVKGMLMFLGATKLPIKERIDIEEKLSKKNMEKLFPYALALELEKAWARKFSTLFGAASYDRFVNEHPYASTSFRTSFASDLAKGAQKPSSGSGDGSNDSISSGSSGGGFAGSGGGGGGGGGR